jgi:hypothetical protein
MRAMRSVGHHAHYGKYQAQVGGGGLAARENLCAAGVDFQFRRIDLFLAGDHVRDLAQIAGGQRFQRGSQLRLDQASHGQNLLGERRQFGVELLRDVLA